MDRMSQEAEHAVLREPGGAEYGPDPCNQPDELHRESQFLSSPTRPFVIHKFGLVRRPIPVGLLRSVESGSSNLAIAQDYAPVAFAPSCACAFRVRSSAVVCIASGRLSSGKKTTRRPEVAGLR